MTKGKLFIAAAALALLAAVAPGRAAASSNGTSPVTANFHSPKDKEGNRLEFKDSNAAERCVHGGVSTGTAVTSCVVDEGGVILAVFVSSGVIGD
jgi:hypothetical protein